MGHGDEKTCSDQLPLGMAEPMERQNREMCTLGHGQAELTYPYIMSDDDLVDLLEWLKLTTDRLQRRHGKPQ